MACFLVPAGEAIVTTIAAKAMKSHEKKCMNSNENTLQMSQHLDRLNGFLWGGSALLAFEHIWHGEITPFFPFLTAAATPADTIEMLHEMAVSGTAMAAAITAVWAVITFVSINKHRHIQSETERSC